MRCTNHTPSPSLASVLARARADAAPQSDVLRGALATATGSHALSDDPLAGYSHLVVRSVAHARRLLLRSHLCAGHTLALPANATPALVGAVARTRVSYMFAPLATNLALQPPRHSLAWAQPLAAAAPLLAAPHPGPVVADYGDLPPALGLATNCGITLPSDVLLLALHTTADPNTGGALLLFRSPRLAAAVAPFVEAGDQLDCTPQSPAASHSCELAAWLMHWQTVAAAQSAVLATLAAGLHFAAGLPIAASPQLAAPLVLDAAVLVQIPAEVPPATFYAYAAAENTPVAWLPLLRPIYHGAAGLPCAAPTAHNLARWLAVPASPAYSETDIAQAVLGIVKAAEYLGVRWRSDPARAAAYATLLDVRYGEGHSAYRPIFPVPSLNDAPAAALAAQEFTAHLHLPTCQCSSAGGTHDHA